MAQDPAIRWLTLTVDGETTLGLKIRTRGTVLVVASGSFGGGSLSGGYLDDTGTFQTFGIAALTADGVLELPAGGGMTLVLDLDSSTTPTIKIGYVADTFEPATA